MVSTVLMFVFYKVIVNAYSLVLDCIFWSLLHQNAVIPHLKANLIGNDVHELIVTILAMSRGGGKNMKYEDPLKLLIYCSDVEVDTHLCKLKKLPLSGWLLKFCAIRTAMSLRIVRLLCQEKNLISLMSLLKSQSNH